MCIDYQRKSEFQAPTCKCGHDREAHEIEPPYYCNGITLHGDEMCGCEGYTIPAIARVESEESK